MDLDENDNSMNNRGAKRRRIVQLSGSEMSVSVPLEDDQETTKRGGIETDFDSVYCDDSMDDNSTNEKRMVQLRTFRILPNRIFAQINDYLKTPCDPKASSFSSIR